MSRKFTLMERVFESALVEEKERLDTSLTWTRTIKRLLPEEARGVEHGEPAMATPRERREREQMADVKAALKRLDDGAYGRCELCGEPIELCTLLEMPWTRYCSSCLADTPTAPSSGLAPPVLHPVS
jgi:RNA polymerase-binding transcription factor DksA